MKLREAALKAITLLCEQIVAMNKKIDLLKEENAKLKAEIVGLKSSQYLTDLYKGEE